MFKETNRDFLHYEIKGAPEGSPWLVFVHGAGGSIKTWQFQIEAFAKDFRLLLLDLRDHGYSKEMTPAYDAYDFDIVSNDVLKIIDRLKIERAHFMSLSVGSVILQKIDILRPKLINKMIMAGAIFDGSKYMYAFVHCGKLLTYVLPFRVFYSLFSFIVLPRKNHRLSRYIFRKQSKIMTTTEYLKWVHLYKPFFKLIKQYVNRELPRPCLIVMGNQDHIFLNSAKKFANKQKNAFLTVIKGCGHVVSIESPNIFNQLALDFINNKNIPKEVQTDKSVPYKWKDLKALSKK